MSESDEKPIGRLRTIDAVSEWTGLSTETIRKKILQGLIESHKLFGRRLVSEEEIIRLIKESKSKVPARGEKRPRVDVVQTPTRGRRSR